ncbi:hypothetical protein SKAU_G00015940 [Synaphobranchus kaupii]|uniref:Uncharacterized protein n=1 Tax=Synaphobranchus kaupii TaxID=118154 RepID=A0A9Q1JBQ0_SYNKA|nr:hypothetical protein SKAU_G00015940 [Synaphobranchus kaupii]
MQGLAPEQQLPEARRRADGVFVSGRSDSWLHSESVHLTCDCSEKYYRIRVKRFLMQSLCKAGTRSISAFENERVREGSPAFLPFQVKLHPPWALADQKASEQALPCERMLRLC